MKNHRQSRLLSCALPALIIFVLALFSLTGCSSGEEAADPGIEDGTYVAEFTTDNAMFHVSDANNDRGILTVEDGRMSIHISLQSKKIVNLFPGTAEDAGKDGAELLEPTTDTVIYSDGYEEEVYGFDVPVPALDEEFDLALLGTKGKWYDHKVSVHDPVPGDDIRAAVSDETSGEQDPETSAGAPDLEDGEYSIEVAMEGGSGRASIESPTTIRLEGDKAVAVITWSSPHYDYMIVDGERYEPVNTEGNSVFEIPVLCYDSPMTVIGDTTAMSEPHEIEYTLTFDSSSIK